MNTTQTHDDAQTIAVRDANQTADVRQPTANEAANAELVWRRPDIDLLQGEAGYLLIADMPGVARDQAKLTLDRDVLTVEGRWAHAPQGELLLDEAVAVNYKRSLKLPEGLDLEAISAKLNDGVLEVQLPFAAARQPRQIEVQGIH